MVESETPPNDDFFNEEYGQRGKPYLLNKLAMRNVTFPIKYLRVLCGAQLLLCFFLLGCSNSDITEELSNGYFYRDEGENTNDILSHLPHRKDIF